MRVPAGSPERAACVSNGADGDLRSYKLKAICKQTAKYGDIAGISDRRALFGLILREYLHFSVYRQQIGFIL